MSVFDTLYASQYDLVYAGKDYSGECDLVEAAVTRSATTPVRRILDIGCGTGSHAIELARRGYEVTGVDLSQSMLDQAAEKSSPLSIAERPTWLCGDIRDVDTGETFDLAVMMFAVIGYLTATEDVLQALRNVRRQLEPGALFVCDFWYGPAVLSVQPSDRIRVLTTDTGRVVRTASTVMDVPTHTAEVTVSLMVLEGDRLVADVGETHILRYFFPKEFELMLSLAGFELCSMSGFPSLELPVTNDHWNALVVARAS